ncbi:MAG: polysaccharide deacetylase family protein [Thermaceae bacterium]
MEVLSGVLLLYLLSDILFRFLGVGAHAHGSRRSPTIALTFDDGPSERTEELLDLLRSHGVRATFFLTGQRAEEKPDLARRIREEGHQVEAHGYWHSPWLLLSPFHEWLHIQRSPGRYYRPPHGFHTPFTRLFARLQGKKVALWDTESKDWRPFPPERLADRLLNYIRPGSIVLFHDGPERTLRILEILLPKLLELGYQPVTLDDLKPIPLSPRLALIRGLQGFDERFHESRGTIRAGLGPFDLFRLEKKPLPWDLPGLPKGSIVYELHLESQRAMELSPLEAIRAIRESMRKVAQHVEEDPGIQGVYGANHFTEGGRIFGFHTHPLPPREAFWANLAGIWFMWLYRGRVYKGFRIEAAYLNREEFLKRFPPSRNASKEKGAPPPETPPS